MKSVFLLLSLLMTLSVYAAPREPVRTMEIPQSCTEIIIDGLADQGYSEYQSTNIFNPTGWEDESDFTAGFRTCWDSDYLYLYVEIIDDINHAYEPGFNNPWEFDNVEIFLQLDTNTVISSYSSTTVQLRICRGLDSMETTGHAQKKDFLYFMNAESEDGWITEVAIPWTSVLAEGSLPKAMNNYYHTVIGFELHGADSDNIDGDPSVGNRDVQSAWDDDDPYEPDDHGIDPIWNNITIFGYVTLLAKNCSQLALTPLQENKLKIVPNPAQQQIQLLYPESAISLSITGIQGYKVLEESNFEDGALDISYLPTGMYLVLINGRSSGRFIKK
ncbi:MAG: hypothetical protein JW801_09170 [Bacteroidales bacterium]|nr:hypothetical protein [Bacteroidales bacterium]